MPDRSSLDFSGIAPAVPVSVLVQKYAQKYDVPLSVVQAVMGAESGGNQNARSSAGAIGVMQLMPATAQDLGVNPHDTEQNVKGGVQYLRQMLDRFGGDRRLALAAYNAGPGAVEKYGDVPPYSETQQYVQKVQQQAGPAVDFTGIEDTQKAPSSLDFSGIEDTQKTPPALDFSGIGDASTAPSEPLAVMHGPTAKPEPLAVMHQPQQPGVLGMRAETASAPATDSPASLPVGYAKTLWSNIAPFLPGTPESQAMGQSMASGRILTDIYGAHVAEAQKMIAAATAGDYPTAVRHAAGMLPIIGPMLSAEADKAVAGKPWEATGDVLALATLAKGLPLRAAREGLGTLAEDVRAAGNSAVAARGVARVIPPEPTDIPVRTDPAALLPERAPIAPEPVIDQIGAGLQPRLPGDVGAVRDLNVQTPEFDAPFSLIRQVAPSTSATDSLLGSGLPSADLTTAPTAPTLSGEVTNAVSPALTPQTGLPGPDPAIAEGGPVGVSGPTSRRRVPAQAKVVEAHQPVTRPVAVELQRILAEFDMFPFESTTYTEIPRETTYEAVHAMESGMEHGQRLAGNNLIRTAGHAGTPIYDAVLDEAARQGFKTGFPRRVVMEAINTILDDKPAKTKAQRAVLAIATKNAADQQLSLTIPREHFLTAEERVAEGLSPVDANAIREEDSTVFDDHEANAAETPLADISDDDLRAYHKELSALDSAGWTEAERAELANVAAELDRRQPAPTVAEKRETSKRQFAEKKARRQKEQK